MHRNPFFFLFALLLAQTVTYATAQCESIRAQAIALPDSSPLKCGHVCPAERGWKVLPLLWAPLNVEINCSSSSYTIMTAHSLEQLVSADAVPVKWCGWGQILNDPRVCRFKLSPLQDQFLAVDPASSGLLPIGSSGFTCVVNSTRELSIPHMCLTVIGVLLFYNAVQLTMSSTFRLTSGSLMFMSGAVVVLAFVLARSMPYKKSLMAFFTVSTSSMLAVVRWLYGTWLPDAESVLFSRPFLIYLAVSGLLGLAVTYWMDDPSNVKLNTTIRVTLQLSGLLMVFMGISDERVGIGVMVLLVFSGWLLAIARRLGMALLWVLRSTWQLTLWVLRSTWQLTAWVLRSSWRLVSRSQQPAVAATSAVRSHAAGLPGGAATGRRGRSQNGLRAAAGSPLPEDDEPLLSDEEAEYVQRHRSGRWFDTREKQLSTLPSFEDWVPSPTGHARHGDGELRGTPLHLKHRPPLSPYALAHQPALQQQQQQAVGTSGYRAEAHAGEDAGGYKFPSSSTSPNTSNSPWGRERLAVDVTKRMESPGQQQNPLNIAAPVPAAAAGPSSRGAAGESVSPLVAMGKILNPETGRPILMNRGKYNELVSQGYHPDLKNGILVPPADAPAEAWAGVSRPASGGRAAAAGSSGGSARGPSPSSNTRQRRSRQSAGTAAPR